MIKLPITFLLILIASIQSNASITLTAVPNANGSSVSLRWNMVNYSSVTAYILMKSEDGVVWQIAAANPVFRNYTSSTILAYNDRVKSAGKIYYRVRVYDRHDNTVAISNTAIAQIQKERLNSSAVSQPQSENVYHGQSKVWKIYPNPVRDVLTLSYQGGDRIRGVINLQISDATGKIVIRFRQASNNKLIRIPVSNLRAGIYFIKINVLNEMQMNEKFMKQ